MDIADIRVFKENESKVRIATNLRINKELRNFFSAKAPGYQFMPKYKSGIWDGILRFYSYNCLPIGLSYDKLDEFCKRGRYSLFRAPGTTSSLEIEESDWYKFIEILQIPLEVRDYQFKSSLEAITKKKLNIHSPTASGKSLIIYIIARFLEQAEKKLLIIVPTTNLVEQTYSEFIEYGWGGAWEKVVRIYSGKEKIFDVPVVLSTWQSIFREEKLFEQFNALIIDESHGTKAKSITGITEKCINSEWRIGLSGTYPDENTADWYAIVGALGPIKIFTTYKELEEKGYIAGLKIHNIFLHYPKQVAKHNLDYCYKSYHGEVDFTNSLMIRNEFITKLAKSMKKNTFVLFTRRKHGRQLRDMIRKTGKRVLYIDGEIGVEERERIRKILELKNNIVLVASFGTFSQGANVKNVHNIIFASNYKSKIRVLQSIGRGLRKIEGKDQVTIYDIIDNFKQNFINHKGVEEEYYNYSILHYQHRSKIYKQQGFNKPIISNVRLG